LFSGTTIVINKKCWHWANFNENTVGYPHELRWHSFKILFKNL